MRSSICLSIAVLFSVTVHAQNSTLNLIPWPLEVKQHSGYYHLKDKITVSNSSSATGWQFVLNYLKSEMKKQFGITVIDAAKGKKGDIDFFMKRMPTSGKPAYTLEVNERGISINSNFDEPAFHAIQTLFQLIPVDPKKRKEIPFVDIFDHARFEYRGMHLDVSRHFSPISFIKKYIDYLAYHKLNTFHWHLTDDQGWRIEIKKYPKLTSIGSKRNGTIIGRYPSTGSDNKAYGGFYTQAEIKEVVQYAKERFVEVIPEIEMPGHGSAAIAAYPWLSCFPEKPTDIPSNMISKKSVEEQKKGRIKLVQETWGVFDDVFCAGKEETFTFLQNVIDEVMPLFSSNYFHIGGDECPKTHWKICPNCQQRMKENNLKDEHELQSWFVQRIEKYLNSKRKTLIGWDEILEGGLAPNAVVMSWRGEAGGIEAAKQKHKVIMTPGNPLYFDHSQSENEDSVTIGGYNQIEKVYAYDPIPKELTEEEGKYILGAQANLWREYIRNEKKTEYMIFPRMAALSEILWTTKENKNWPGFEKRLQEQFKRYDLWKVNYSLAFYDLNATVIPNETNDGVLLKIDSKNKGERILFHNYPAMDSSCIDSKPTLSTDTLCYICLDKTPFIKKINCSGTYGYTLVGKNLNTPLVIQKFKLNKATGKKINLTNEASKSYPGDGAFTLVNGVQNEKGLAKSKEFLGFSGTDCVATIDLGKPEMISNVVIHGLKQQGSWIWQPLGAEVFSFSGDSTFTSLGITYDFAASNSGNGTMTINFKETTTRFVIIKIKNYGIIPEGNPGAGNKAWLFVDEIEVN